MRFKTGQDFIDKLRFSVINKEKYKRFKCGIRVAFGKENALDPLDIHATHRIYGKIYYPNYNIYFPFDCRHSAMIWNCSRGGGIRYL